MQPIPRPPDGPTRLRSVAEVCDVLRSWGEPDLADRIAYFASNADLDDGDVPVTLESALGFLAFFGAVESEGQVELGCSQEGWICAEWDFYTRIIEPLGHNAKQRNDNFATNYGSVINRLSREFSEQFCDKSGAIDWNKLVAFSSAKANRT